MHTCCLIGLQVTNIKRKRPIIGSLIHVVRIGISVIWFSPFPGFPSESGEFRAEVKRGSRRSLS
eukprot:455391-Amphidinium_carterae.1